MQYRYSLSRAIFGFSLSILTLIISSLTINNIDVQAQNFNTKISQLIAQSNRTIRIRFAPGRTDKTVKDSVIRGTRDIYLLGAKASQTMNISLTSLENNAVFDLVTPDGIMLKQEVTNANLVLPLNGDYKVIVGGTRGNATYELSVEIK